MYSAQLQLTENAYAAVLSWQGDDYTAAMSGGVTFTATMSTQIRMLPNAALQQAMSDMSADLGDTGFDFEQQIDNNLTF